LCSKYVLQYVLFSYIRALSTHNLKLSTYNNNWYENRNTLFKYKLKRCSKKECCKQCRHAKFKGTMTKNTQNNTKTPRTPKRNRHSDKTRFCVIFGFLNYFLFICKFLNKPKCKMCVLSESVSVPCYMIFYHDMYKTPPAYMIYQYYQSSVHFHKLSFA